MSDGSRPDPPPGEERNSRRRYSARNYLTKGAFPGSQARSACDPGYHFAALWEILDPSALGYNTELGQPQSDSGQGPPSTVPAWVRTGQASHGPGGPGTANCAAWTSDSGAHSGTYVFLPSDWTAGDEDLLGWAVAVAGCNFYWRVWCVEDVGHVVYLPLILRDYGG